MRRIAVRPLRCFRIDLRELVPAYDGQGFVHELVTSLNVDMLLSYTPLRLRRIRLITPLPYTYVKHHGNLTMFVDDTFPIQLVKVSSTLTYMHDVSICTIYHVLVRMKLQQL